jgi:predicted metal-dependent phosphoesterase TrpH
MKQWLPYELHTHTFHSDGEHSLLELAISAKELGLFGIAMTDHNTMSPLLERDRIQAQTRHGVDYLLRPYAYGWN